MEKLINGYVINLEESTERKLHIMNEFQDTQIQITLFNAIKH